MMVRTSIFQYKRHQEERCADRDCNLQKNQAVIDNAKYGRTIPFNGEMMDNKFRWVEENKINRVDVSFTFAAPMGRSFS